MDPRTNPYTPNAGAPPPALVGRDAELEGFDILLERLRRLRRAIDADHRSPRSGQDRPARAFESRARAGGWITVTAEITKNEDFGARMGSMVRRALFQVAPKSSWGEKLRRAAGALRSFSITVAPDGSITAGIDLEPLEGTADSGNLSDDLTDLLVVLGEAAEERDGDRLPRRRGSVPACERVRSSDRRPPPDGPATAPDHARRGRPPATASACRRSEVVRRAALQVPADREALPARGRVGARRAGRRARRPVRAGRDGGDRRLHGGLSLLHPGVRQDRLGPGPEHEPISRRIAQEAQRAVEAKLDESFRVRAQRTTELELQYLRAMAELGPVNRPPAKSRP